MRTSQKELDQWQALQVWLNLAGERRVKVPFARALAETMPTVAVRLRRDFSTVLSLVRAHALLHQMSRDRDEVDRIVATLEDYSVVRELVGELLADEVGATVAETIKKTVDAVEAVAQFDVFGTKSASNKQVAAHLGIDPGSASRRLKVAAEKGYVQNLETKRGVAARWVLGDALPENQEFLPSPEALDNHCGPAVLDDEDEDPPLPSTGSVLV